jgi:hypothetical protein
MNFVNRIRIIAALLAMVMVSLGVYAEDSAENTKVNAKASSRQLDRLDLDATSVTGNQELPRVLYILPWKESGLGDLTGKPVNSLLDEVLAPLDREVFQRQVKYFDQLHANDSSHAAKQD